MSDLNERVTALHNKCKKLGGCKPGEETISRMVRIKQNKGVTVEDYRDLTVCVRCGVPINNWR